MITYKIIIPFETPGFNMDAQILEKRFTNSKIFISDPDNNLPESEINIFIDRVKDIDVMKTAKINVLSANQEVILKTKDYAWQIPFVRKLDYVLTKTKYGTKIMEKLKKKYNLKYQIYYIGHTTIFPIRKIHQRDYSTILHLAGSHEFKNTDTVIKCWQKYPNLPHIVIGCYNNCIKNSLKKYLTKDEYDSIMSNKNISFLKEGISFDDLVVLKYYYAIHLCPSITEGYGHYINEARITKSLLITVNLPPMNEFVDDGVSGLLINCDNVVVNTNFNEMCFFNPETLAKTIDRAMSLTKEEIDEYGNKAYDKYVSDTEFFLRESKKVNEMFIDKVKN